MKVFLHVSHKSTYIGNGGFLMSVNLANEIGKMGYDTYILSENTVLTWKDFEWLSLKECYFKLATFRYMLNQHVGDYRIISLNLLDLNKIPNEVLVKYTRKWDMDDLFRVGAKYEWARRFTLKHLEKIAIVNRHLEAWYRKIGYNGEIIILENWIRNDLFNTDEKTFSNKIPNSVGFQRDGCYREVSLRKFVALMKKTINPLKNRHTDLHRVFANVIPCHGPTHHIVAEKMKKADFFLFFHKPKNFIVPIGEGFGLSLFEAMACGCVVVAVQQEQIMFLHNTIPLVETVEDAIVEIKKLIDDNTRAEKIRTCSLKTIQKNYRYDNKRKQAITKLLK